MIERFVDELAKVFADADHAVLAVKRAGFPIAMIPVFSDPLSFWSRVVEHACNGALPGGLRPLIAVAAERYPSNLVFAGPIGTPVPEAARVLRASVETSFELMRLLGARGHRYLSVRFDLLYVPPKLLPDPKGRRLVDAESSEEAERVLMGDGFRPISVFDAFEWAKRCNRDSGLLLVGDPGSGKTTLLEYLALQVVSSDPLAFGLIQDIIPLFVRLRDLDVDETIEGLVLRTMADRCRDSHAARSLLESHPLLFLLDGLDEIPWAERRGEVLAWVDAMHQRSPGSRFVVSCRYTSHGQIPFNRGTGLLDLHMCLLSAEEQGRLVYNWHLAIEASTNPAQDRTEIETRALYQAQVLSAALRDRCAEQPRLVALVRNPLLLTALCVANRTQGTLPWNRVDVLRECLDALVEPWRLAERPRRNLDPRHVWALLRAIALSLHMDRRADHATPSLLVEVVDAQLRAMGCPVNDVAEVETLLRSLRDETGILVGKRGDSLGFVHAGLQEYLCADALVALAKIDPTIWKDVAVRFGDDWWYEVIHLIFAWPDGSTFEPLMKELVWLPSFGVHDDWVDSCLAAAPSFSATPFRSLLDQSVDQSELWRQRSVAQRVLEQRGVFSRPIVFEPGVWRPQEPAERHQPLNGGYSLVQIEAGSFSMGSLERDHLAYTNECPAHQVKLGRFMLGRFPVTNGEYREFIRATGYIEPALWADARFRGDDLPVVGVTWDDAMAYCNWAGLTLPTEAQWEYACRAGSTSRYWAGDAEADLERVGWFAKNSDGRTHPAGMKPANAFDLYDMHGNVLEWCLDGPSDYRTRSPGVGDGRRAGSNDTKNARGGSWKFSARGCRAAYRVTASVLYQGNILGFRPALCIEA